MVNKAVNSAAPRARRETPSNEALNYGYFRRKRTNPY